MPLDLGPPQDAVAAAAARAAAAEEAAAELRRQLEGRRAAAEGVMAGRDRRLAELQVGAGSVWGLCGGFVRCVCVGGGGGCLPTIPDNLGREDHGHVYLPV